MSPKPVNRKLVCPWCGTAFETVNARKVYCNRSCTMRAAGDRYQTKLRDAVKALAAISNRGN